MSAQLDSGRSVDEQVIEDSFENLYEVDERVRTGLWVGDCFIYNNSSWRLNYCVGGEVGFIVRFSFILNLLRFPFKVMTYHMI